MFEVDAATAKNIKNEGSRKERAMQSELDSLANVKTTAVANKASKQQQIVNLHVDCDIEGRLMIITVANKRKDPSG